MTEAVIRELTPAQERRLVEFRDEYLHRGLSCEPADRLAAQEAVADAYRVGGLEPPAAYIWLSSPMAGAIAAAMLAGNQVRDQVRAQVEAQVWAAGYGQHDAGWLSFYAYFAMVIGVADAARLAPLCRLSAAAGWWWPFERLCIVTDRPMALGLDAEGRLHSASGPALQYRDGWGITAWHGTRIPDEWIGEKSTLTAKTALTWRNIEQRRSAIEILGWSTILRELDAKTIDADADPEIGTLVEVTLPDLPRPARFLRIRCGTGREFAIGVQPDCKTALEAQAWIRGIPPVEFTKPEVRT